MFSPVSILRRNYQRCKPEPAGSLNTTRILPIGNNDGNACFGNTPSRDILGDGLEVRTASGEQNAKVLHEISMSSAISIRGKRLS